MNYEDISSHAESLSYRDKFRLAQLLIQLARKEEEETNPDKRAASAASSLPDKEMVNYVSERLLKLKPTKKEGVLNSIGAMFQFQGGISDADKEKLFAALVKNKHLAVMDSGKIQYPN